MANPFCQDSQRSLETAPSMFLIGSTWYMTYTGWCLENTTVCPRLSSDRATATLVATSTDAENWTKSTYGNLIPDGSLPTWAPRGIAETHVFLEPGTSDSWVMLFTALDESGPVAIGLATRTGSTPIGAWTVREDPLFDSSDLDGEDWLVPGDPEAPHPVAPHGLIEDDTLRIWFAGQNNGGFKIGYAEAEWPLD